MLRALRSLRRRIIGQPIVPRMQSGIAATDRIILIAPGVVVVRHFVQRRDCGIRILIFKGIFVYRRRRFRDQRLIRNIRGSLNGRLRIDAAECEKEENKKAKKTSTGLHGVILINDVESGSGNPRRNRDIYRFQSGSSISACSCRFKSWRADFLMARRSAATACFSACRSFRVRVSVASGKCVILGRCAPTLRSLGLA